MAKGIREKIKLVSSAGTGHFYTTTKNKRTKPEKLELKNSIQLYASTYCTKLKSNNFSLLIENPATAGFCILHLNGGTMPELPEVETSRRGIEPHLVGATILHAVVRNGRLRWPVSDEIHALSDKPVLSVQRRAKYLLLELPDGWIIIHLGMSGSLRILTEELPAENTITLTGNEQRQSAPLHRSAALWRVAVDEGAGRTQRAGASGP